MAKQIKVIKCPQCGSVQKTEIKPEHYRCDNCQTEYFLDNDDVNVNVNHSYTGQTSSPLFANKMFRFIASAVIVMVVGMIVALFNRSTKTPPPKYIPSTQVKQNTINSTHNSNNAVTSTAQTKYTNINYPYCAVKIDEKPYVLIVEDFYQSTTSPISQAKDYDVYFSVYDLLANKVIKEEKQDKPKLKSISQSNNNWRFIEFPNNQIYLEANQRSIYHLDKNNYKFSHITDLMLNNHPNYQGNGIATVSLTYGTNYNSINILTNDGKKLVYYPQFDEVYEDNYDFQMGKSGHAKPTFDDKTVRLAFSFANRYGEDNKLVKYRYISPKGDSGEKSFEVRSSKVGAYKQDGTSDKHTDEDSAYDFFPNTNLKVQVVAHKNLTPGRLYFDPKIIYYDDNTLIIKTKVDASPESNYNYQRIDIDTGKVIWTIADDQLTTSNKNKLLITPYKDKLIATIDCDSYMVIDNDGKISQRITLKNKKR